MCLVVKMLSVGGGRVDYGTVQVALSRPAPHSDWHPICVYPPLSARPTSLSDLSAHKLHRPPDALAICNIQQGGLQSGGGRCCQISCTFLCETSGYDMKALSVQLSGQQVPKAAVAAGDEHVLLVAATDLVGISDVPVDGGESGQ